MDKYTLENRLIDFAAMVIDFCSTISKTQAGNHLSSQLIRSGTSPALNYGEAQSGESKKDFIHKMQIVLEELRETSINLRIIDRSKLYKSKESIEAILKENNELISIFVKSIETAKKRS